MNWSNTRIVAPFRSSALRCRLATGIAIFSSVAFVSGSHTALAMEAPDAGTPPTTTTPPAPKPPIVVTPNEGGGTATVAVGGNGGIVTVGVSNGDWRLGGKTGDPFGKDFKLSGHLDSSDWVIAGGLGVGGGITITVTAGSGGTTTYGIGGPIGGNGGNGTLTNGPGGTIGTFVQPVGSVNGDPINITVKGTIDGPNGNGIFIGGGIGVGPK